MIPFAVGLLLLWILIVASVRQIKVRLLLVAVPVVAICAPAVSCTVQTAFIPAESAKVAVPNSDATVGLEFYGALEPTDANRYLVLKTGPGEVRQKMSGEPDWVHWPRTSIYLVGDGRIALLGPAFDDYIIDPKHLIIEPLHQGTSSDTWTYLGAFDFGEKYKALKFFSASAQHECTSTRGLSASGMTRPQGRALECHAENLFR